MHTDLPGLEQSRQNPDPARIAQQPEHPGKALHVIRRRQRTPEGIAPFLLAGRPTLPEVCVSAWRGPILRGHLNILSSDQMCAKDTPAPGPLGRNNRPNNSALGCEVLIPFRLNSGETIGIRRGEMVPSWPTGGLTFRRRVLCYRGYHRC